jgi:uncharacterized protein YggT (Ycf19 family)
MAIEEGSTPHQATGAGPEPQVPSENIDRRTGAERRIAQLQVDEERRVAERRAAKHESLARRRYTIDRVTHFVDYLFYLLYGVLAIRFLLALLGARETAGFVQFINSLTHPFYVPFAGIVTRPAVDGGMADLPAAIAILAYIVLHLAVRGLLRVIAARRPLT